MRPLYRLCRTAVGLSFLSASIMAATAPPAPLGAPPSAAASAPGAPLPAGTLLYGVEIVVFRAAAIGAPEDWSTIAPPRGFGSPASLDGPAPQVVRVLSAGDYHLSGVVDDMRVSGTWRPIAHAAWIQNAPNWGTHVGLPLSSVGLEVPGLSGMVYLERAPVYLHLGFDLALRDGSTSYTIDEMHNIRQNEKEYFDHPAFGIIAVVTPIKR